MSTPGWVQRIVLDEFGPPLAVGKRYLHPEDGPIHVDGGCFFDPVYGRVSNHWTWTVEATGEKHGGYGDGRWPELAGDQP